MKHNCEHNHTTDKDGVMNRAERPRKPPHSPLTPHPCGQWVKRINGRLRYFGAWADHEAALRKYFLLADSLHNDNRMPVTSQSGCMGVGDIARLYRERMQRRADRGDIRAKSLADVKEFTKIAESGLGAARDATDLRPSDFDRCLSLITARWGVHRRGRFVICIRSMFKWAVEDELIGRLPKYGDAFPVPEKRLYRRHKRERGRLDLEPVTIRTLIRAASPQLRAMIYLGINCGFGNWDCATLRDDAIDPHRRLIVWPRPKTEVVRMCPMWSETLKAVNRANCNNGPLVFTTRYGNPWIKEWVKGDRVCGTDGIGRQFHKLCDRLGINAQFYSLRRTFRTVADQVRDKPAVDLIMGHVDPSMGGEYVQHIEPERLWYVARHVRNWLGTPNPKAADRKRP